MNLEVKTKNNNIFIEIYYEFIKKEEVKTNKELFSKMCKEGCKNYGKKFSCPPYAKDFISVADKEGVFVLMFLIKLNQINSTEYNKLRIANSIMKSRIDKIMRILEERFNTKFFSTGSCRLCKICNINLKKPCKHPDKMRYSLEATGVDCNSLSKKLFNKPLLWFKDKKSPEHTAVLVGLICNSKDIDNIKKELEHLITFFPISF